jgi:hypothetical protein
MRNLFPTGVKALAVAALLAMPVLAAPTAQAQDASNPYRVAPGRALTQADLHRARARGVGETPLNQADLTGNSAINTITGSNSISSSFGNSGGIVSVIQNTGNNSLFQHSTTVNVTVR